YHRQHYPFVDSKRQTCIDELNFNEDGSIKRVTPTHTGIRLFENPDKRMNIALGKQTKVSSARTYFPTRHTNANFRYEGNFAVDENGGTRWDAGPGATNPWLLVDLGSESTIDAVQTLFEFTNKKYFYTIEYLQQKDASDIDDAATSREWHIYADRSVEGSQFSPVEDTFAGGGSVNARYLRITVFGTDGIPESAEPGNKVNGDNAISIFEFKVFGSQTSNDLDRILEAESFNGQSGIQLEASAFSGVNICGTNNNDFILYKDIDLGNGAKAIQVGIAVGSGDGKMDIRLDAANGELIGSVETKNTGGWQTWKTVTAGLSEKANGKHDIYVVFKAKNDTEGVANIDWLKFCTAYP
ncbi:MAG: carbohydrate-binding protein, partial [Proteiniphilum sp.]|nr:carbohydrate-binding protein [Proteiniphilum sp.]